MPRAFAVDAKSAEQTCEEAAVCQQEVTVNLLNGLHMVPCSQIVKIARDFECTIHIRKEQSRVDAKSIFDLLTLNAPYGTRLVLEATGESAAEAVAQLAALFESNFAAEGEATA
jgi:phosphocarrier protein HPr